MKKLILITATLILPQLALAEEVKDCSGFEKHAKYYTGKLDSNPSPEEKIRLEKELEAVNKRLKECTEGKKYFGLFR